MKRNKDRKYKKARYLSYLILLIIIVFLLLPNNINIYPFITVEELIELPKSNATPTPTATSPPTSTSMPTQSVTTSNDNTKLPLTKEELYLLSANTVIDISIPYDNYINNTFYSMKLDDAVIKRIYGKSYKDNPTITYEDLRYIRVLHFDFMGQVRIGELIVHKDISDDIVDIFHELYEAKYPIEKMVLIDEYNGDDNSSMADNNTSAFNYREITGSSTLSKHSMGLAIDINPLYNPYVKAKDDIITILPKEGEDYIDRTMPNEYYIYKDDVCYEAFMKRGFTWGGSWNSLKDYQHFEK